jgi:glutamate dehydrogenase
MATEAAQSTSSKTARNGGADKLVGALAKRIAGSLLPGDVAFAADHLADAARFVLDAAAIRTPGQPVIAISSAAEGRRFMRIALINDDMPFLVDSVAGTVAAQGLAIDRLVHPVVAVERDAEGMLTNLPE